MSRLVDEALAVAAQGWFQNPHDGLRGALVALLDAGMLTAPPGPAAAPQVVRELPEPARGDA